MAFDCVGRQVLEYFDGVLVPVHNVGGRGNSTLVRSVTSPNF